MEVIVTAFASSLAEAIASFITILFGLGIATIICYILLVIASWKLFAKAGESGWKSLIPILNGHVLYKIAWKPVWFWINLLLVIGSGVATYFLTENSGNTVALLASGVLGLLTLILYIVFCVKISKAFGKGGGFAFGMMILPNLFLLILAFGKARYVKGGNAGGYDRRDYDRRDYDGYR